ncbi:hypothetical protein P170DRAFT_471414 [Aspergillus steynii IBT 23096]|uniref:Zn(2)-C6 fungal-type domain-containing protein n=1 Tax=Aspergillus steynii IBT 23096 TaxID=1392250 RepID=A0A2I2GF29_9EURO|nr:uncharacterized protein P170DRAFT_471414 [Aspergillus steynii IBT 23096]PLB51482.1 hypothetical protein P170DRAFT_471414 [Aspergillus steynii IBT 23096]
MLKPSTPFAPFCAEVIVNEEILADKPISMLDILERIITSDDPLATSAQSPCTPRTPRHWAMAGSLLSTDFLDRERSFRMTSKLEPQKRDRHTSRASFACHQCKKSKRRCDISKQVFGSTKSCSTCRERNEKCDLRSHGDDKRKQRQGVKPLQASVAMLERELAILSAQQASGSDGAPLQMRYSCLSSRAGSDADLPPEASTFSFDPKQPSHSSSGVLEIPGIDGCFGSFGASGSSVSSREHVENSKDPPEFPIGMDEVTPPSGDLDQDKYGNEHYFGASSMLPYGDRQSSSPKHLSDVKRHLAQKEDISPSSLEDFIEPEPIVSHLPELFWTYQASHLLIIDRDIFLRHRELARSGNGIGDRNYYTPCLLYSMLALASLISTDRGVKRYASAGGTPGDLFNARARALFDLEMECPTVTTAQAAILIESRYGTFVDSSLGWTFSGIALRVVTKLGLHLDCSRMVASKRITEEEARYRSVAFWGSYIEDRLYSAYCQRPMMLMDWDITIGPPQSQPLNAPYISCHLLPHTVSLSQICGRTLLGLYAQRHLHSAKDGLKKIAFEIHGQLWNWQQSLPDDLIWSTADSSTLTPPSVLVLHMQFYYNLILVHRPLLGFSKAREELSQAPDSSLTTSTITCAISAANIAKLVRDYRELYDIRQITPNGVHMTFIAATIHLINFRLTSHDSHGQLFWDCVKALSEMADSYPMAEKAGLVLNSLIERFKPLEGPSSQ